MKKKKTHINKKSNVYRNGSSHFASYLPDEIRAELKLPTYENILPIYDVFKRNYSGMKKAFPHIPTLEDISEYICLLKKQQLIEAQLYVVRFNIENFKNLQVIEDIKYGILVTALEHIKKHYDENKSIFTGEYQKYADDTTPVHLTPKEARYIKNEFTKIVNHPLFNHYKDMIEANKKLTDNFTIKYMSKNTYEKILDYIVDITENITHSPNKAQQAYYEILHHIKKQ